VDPARGDSGDEGAREADAEEICGEA